MAGVSNRFQSHKAKQFHSIDASMWMQKTNEAWPFEQKSLPVFELSQRLIVKEVHVEQVILVVPPSENIEQFASDEITKVIHGGETRFDSFCKALNSIENENSILLVTDAARPFLKKDFLSRVEVATKNCNEERPCFVPTLAVNDSLCQINNKEIISYIDRSKTARLQTPQIVHVATAKAGLKKVKVKADFTDEGSFMHYLGHKVLCFDGCISNQKITFKEDLFNV